MRPARQPARRLAGRHAQHHPRPFLPRRAGGVKRSAGAASANPGKNRRLQGERAAAGGGGGSRNALWNQIKANRLGIPIKVLDDAETTVAGAAMFGWYGVGEFSSPEQARAQVAYRYRYFWPQTEPELIEEA
ncbi:FGGY-family carbohydrate kinase [Klebsiella pneumoniae]|nr:FGGY-family carbohydrate kinase [Klebsiella pneumoniae]